MDGIIRVRALERSRHRLVHGERERVLLVGPVHPDGADAIGISDDHMLGHQVYPISLYIDRNLDPVPAFARWGRHPSRAGFPQCLGRPLIALLMALSFVRGIYSDSVIRRRLDRGPDVVPGASCSARQLWNRV